MNAEIGAAIHMGPNASKILLAWGLDEQRLNSPNVQWVNNGFESLRHYKSRADCVLSVPLLFPHVGHRFPPHTL
jgi:salicylate hydroxylase